MSDSDTYAAHAERCRVEASEATLDNVRDRALRSESAWSAMATRSAKVEKARSARESRTAAELTPGADEDQTV